MQRVGLEGSGGEVVCDAGSVSSKLRDWRWFDKEECGGFGRSAAA